MRRTVAAVLIPCFCLFAAGAVQAADSTRQLPSFIAINAKGAFAMTVEVGKAQSVRISGEDKFVASLKTEVIDNELQITLPDKTYKGTQNDPRIIITVPSLSRVKVEGAGETLLNKINTDRIDISYLGAGHLAANGKVKYLRLNAKGVGEVDTSKLQAERVDVNFEGVGNVSVYATDLLNAVAKGIGGLTYYGHPKTVNKSVAGIGNVRAGD
ncbi:MULTISPECIES: GIN domain-containing protein [unclassified Duganella]|jgi:hypothetical protein|uniref:GIN domain-containing protein n=1 Tax=unclassified Duganella TaxID=2636909 RepID=UPI0008876096|nr:MULTISPECIES: DUF2807 domain-containing protein [unclassified Duganella]SDH16179.1 Putative auto-transporter adhesin, head GIN domain [Duganella sp. OV458]SDK30699.1 Putative auto-transporter adhesin, head GIN domain [Duganella sp. OV510]